MPSHHWARNFTVDKDDIEALTGLLLEREIPLTSEEHARTLIQERLDKETAALRERFKDAQFYNPSQTYSVGQKIIFPTLDYASGVVVGMRPGNNPDYGQFNVIRVTFEDEDEEREFAADLTVPHELSREDGNGSNPIRQISELTADDVLKA